MWIYKHGCARLGDTQLTPATVVCEALVHPIKKQFTCCYLERFLVCSIGQIHSLPDFGEFYSSPGCSSLCSAETHLGKASSGESCSVICLRITATSTKHYQQNVPKCEILSHVLQNDYRKYPCVS